MKISVIIPCKTKKDLCPQLLPALKNQTHKNLEIIIVSDKLQRNGPASKRDFGAQKARGSILAFIDSDAYPDKNWLKNAVQQLTPKSIAAVCGPGLTPPTNTRRQQISGLVWSTKLGAGLFTYRNRPEKKRFIDDYPTFNFIVKKKDFKAVKGFNTNYWPGEDTKLCHDLTYQLKKKIVYHPKVIVFHHRRPVFLPHLKQISRYGEQRGRFVKLFPKTSRRLAYFLPLLLVLILPAVFPLYLLALIFTSLYHRSILLAPAIFLTHFTYALFFIKGLLT